MKKRFFNLLLCMLMVLLMVAPSAAQSAPDLPTYNAWLREAFAAAQRRDRLGLEAVAEHLTATTEVRINAQHSLSIDNQWLVNELNQANVQFDKLEQQIGGIIDALAQPLGTTPADAQARLDNILNNPPYAERQSNTNWKFLEDFSRWLGRLFNNVFSPFSGSSSAPLAMGSQIILWLGIIFLVALVVYAIWKIRAIFIRDALLVPEDFEEQIDAKEAFDYAGDMAQKGQYRDAMRFLYLSALLWLDEKQYLRYDRALTNREYLERTRENPELTAKLKPIVETFDRVWYGHNELTADDYAQYRQQIERLRAET